MIEEPKNKYCSSFQFLRDDVLILPTFFDCKHVREPVSLGHLLFTEGRCQSEFDKLKRIYDRFNRNTLLLDCIGKTVSIVLDNIAGDANVLSQCAGLKDTYRCLCLTSQTFINLNLRKLLLDGKLFIKRSCFENSIS